MRNSFALFLSLVSLGAACGSGTDSQSTSAGSSPASSSAAKGGSLIGADARARCGGFGIAQAAEILGVAASAVTDRSQDITPTARGCEFAAGDRKIGFTLTVEPSIDDAKSALAQMRDTYVTAARAQESATGKKIEEGAYSEIFGVGDEALWSVTNTSMIVRHRNLTILVMLPNDKQTQAAVARKVIESL
jgi:hypothetical protein